MTKPYPMALRERAVRIVEAGESRHAVAERLGVSAPTVVRWLQGSPHDRQCRTRQGWWAPQAEDRRPHRDWFLDQVNAGDVTLHGLADGLSARGLKVDAVTVWNFLCREGKRFKRPCMALNRTARTLPDGATGGRSIRTGSRLRGLFSSTRPGRRPTWLRSMAGEAKVSG